MRAGLGQAGLADHATAPIGIPDPADGSNEIEVTAAGRRLLVSLGVGEFRFHGSCKSLEAGRVSVSRRTVFVSARPP